MMSTCRASIITHNEYSDMEQQVLLRASACKVRTISQFLYNSLTPETRKETSTDYRTVKLECSIVVNYEDTEQGNCCGNHKEDRKHSQIYRTGPVVIMIKTLTCKTS